MVSTLNLTLHRWPQRPRGHHAARSDANYATNTALQQSPIVRRMEAKARGVRHGSALGIHVGVLLASSALSYVKGAAHLHHVGLVLHDPVAPADARVQDAVLHIAAVAGTEQSRTLHSMGEHAGRWPSGTLVT